MIVRLVELFIQEDKLDLSRQMLSRVAPKVRQFSGCTKLRIIEDLHNPGHITTYSHWHSEDDLNAYRNSDVFKDFWREIKPLFAERARAWSSTTLHHLP